MASKYDKLEKTIDYDHEAAEQLAEALNEITALDSKVAELKALVEENEELHQYVWRTAENKVIALHDIEHDHFVNILSHQARNGRTISKALRDEARRRGVPLPPKSVSAVVAYHQLEDYIDSLREDEELPF